MATTGTTKVDPVSMATAWDLIQRLYDLGVGEADVRRAVFNPGITREIAQILLRGRTLPHRLSPQGCIALIDVLHPARFDEMNGHSNSSRDDIIFQDEAAWLSDEFRVKMLLLELTSDQLEVVLLRNGLRHGSTPLSTAEVAAHLNLRQGVVNKLLGDARKTMRSKSMALCAIARKKGHFPRL